MIILGVGVMFIAAVQRSSFIDFSKVKIDTTDIFIFAGIILAAIGAIWGIRKMIVLGYLSSVPGHWQKKYDREKDLADYKEFRDEGGFETGTRLGSFGGRSWYFDRDHRVDLEEWLANDSFGDDLEDEYVGSVGDKSWYYDSEGNVYSNFDEIEEDEDDDVVVFESYEAREAYRAQINDYDDNKEQFLSDIEYIDWRDDWNEWIDSASYEEDEEDLNIGWEK